MPTKKTSKSSSTHRHAPHKPHHLLLYSVLFCIIFGATYILVSGFNWAGNEPVAEMNTENSLKGVYTGTTPCADCPGIKTTLTLSESASGHPTTYTLSLDYIDRDTKYTEKGKWTQSIWKNKTLITLVPQDSAQVTYYQVLSPTEIRQLDGERNDIPDSMPFTLTKTNK